MPVPPDPEFMNNKRADWARDVLGYFEQYGESPHPDLTTEEQRDMAKQNLSDLIADIGHYCDRNELRMDEVIRIASDHYAEETHYEGLQFRSAQQS
jgi:hypothetical protein